MRIRFGSGSSHGLPSSTAGKVGTSIFFGIFAVMGLVFLGIMALALYDMLVTHTWQATPATITASEVETDRGQDDPYAVSVEYEYQYEGQTHTGRQLQRDEARFADRSEASQLADRFAAGQTVDCYVNPGDPNEAVLIQPSPAKMLVVGAFSLIPLVFVGVGFGGLYFTWRRRPAERGASPQNTAVSLGADRSKRWARPAMTLFFLFFLLFGGIFPTMFFIVPAMGVWQARNWDAVEAKVLDSRVRSHSGDDGTTYSIDIEFEYEYDGQTHRANRYDFSVGSSSGYDSKRRVVDEHRPGSTVTAYVNPANPHEAVINRELSGSIWFGAIAFIFPLIGVAGLIGVGVSALRARGATGQAAALTAGLPTSVPFDTATADEGDTRTSEPAGPVTLKPAESRLGGFVALLVIAVIWNGAVYFMFGSSLFSGGWTGFDLLTLLFGGIFALVGLGVIGLTGYQGMRLLNPTATVRISEGRIRPGRTVDLEWELTGRTHRLANLTVAFVGREEATYQQGTNTRTDKHVFAEPIIFQTDDPQAIPRGSVTVRIPERMMHSFTADHNKIIWTVQLSGTIRRWPDMKQPFEITILPREAPGG